MRPRGSVIIGNSSCCSLMTGLIAERKRTASISYRALLSAPSMMSSVTGSISTPVGISATCGFSLVIVVIGLPYGFGLMRMLKLTSTSAA